MITHLARVLLVIAIAGLVSCGGSSSGGGGDPPKVAGRYSFNTSKFTLACSDGSAGTNGGISTTFRIEQDGEKITLLSENTGPPAPGITIVRATGANGTVSSDGSFEIDEKVAANIKGIPGTVQLTYELDGKFSGKSWSGDYIYRFEISGGTCLFSATFTGKKLKSRPAAETGKSYREDYPIDIYDRFGVVGSNLGAGEQP